jgi:homoserine O-acetyltransferase/O-succinyltransferase
MRSFLAALALLLVTSLASAAAPPQVLPDPDSPQMNRRAPELFDARFDTTRGDIVIRVHRAWAPLAADRFYNLVAGGYYDDSRFYRVIKGKWAQFGINGDPRVSKAWRDRTIPDEPRVETNARGTVAFAFAVPNGRTTQVFINLRDNAETHDKEPFVPFGHVVQGMEAVDALNSEYGESSGSGIRSGKQGPLFERGNAYLDQNFPRLDAIKRATIVALPASTSIAESPGQPAPVDGDFELRDFRFSTGESLPELRLHYVTLGQPRRDDKGVVRNAVLILHGTGGTGRQFLSKNFAEVLFGPGQLLDARTHYLILPDGIGHGRSSKPSDGLRTRFPRYTYADMVAAQYRLLTEGLKVNHLSLVMGTSMGGMQTWMWGTAYPGFMDGLVPLASVPTQIAGRNRMWRKMLMDSIRDDPAWNGGNYTSQPPGLVGAVRILVLMVASTVQAHKNAPDRDAADALLVEQMRSRSAGVDANDMLYQFDSSREYDPSASLDTITAPLLAINSADDLVNPPELGLMETLMPRVRHGRYVLLPITSETRGHGTHSWPTIWQSYFKEWLTEVKER